MFSHSDLLGHDCKHCFGMLRWDNFRYSANFSSVYGQDCSYQPDCLWHVMAKVCFGSITTITQIRPMLLLLAKPGDISIYEDEKWGEWGAGSSEEFECLIKLQDQPSIVKALDGNQDMALLPGQTSSNATFNTIRLWTNACGANHARCERNNLRPKGVLRGIRFLHVGHTSIKLHEKIEPERYACLSHCWGDGKELIKTTVQNRINRMKVGIVIEKLPRTYQDAVIVCKELGIDYLWIDSLCILQGDIKDWETQASRMSDVYENAYVTIAAVGAQDASQGLFSSTSVARTGFILPGYPWVHIRQKVRSPKPRQSSYGTTANDGWSLYKRGWTFQELSLSPRVLHFGVEEVFWSCRQVTVCEGAPTVCDRSLLGAILVDISKPNISLQTLWYEIISAYTFRDLTFGKDKFPAIAAFASRLQATSPENRYVAGLWESTLLYDLLWACFDIRPVVEPPYPIEPGIIPSWSWASTEQPVNWIKIEVDTWQYIPCTEVIEVTYNTRGPPVLGDIVEAFLVLQAPVVSIGSKLDRWDLEGCWSMQGATQNSHLALCDCHWDHLGSSQGIHDHDEMRSGALVIPLFAQKPIETMNQPRSLSNNALIVTKDGPGIYRRAGIGTLRVLNYTHAARPMEGPFLPPQETRHEPLSWSGVGDNDSKESRLVAEELHSKTDEQREEETLRDVMELYRMFIEEMSQLERQVIKLI